MNLRLFGLMALLTAAGAALTACNAPDDNPMDAFFGIQSNIGQSAVVFDPTSYDFGNVAVGGAVLQKITLTNTSSTSVYIKNISTTDSILTILNGCPTLPSPVGAGASCTFSVAFAPIIGGAVSGSVVVSYIGDGINSDSLTTVMGISGYGMVAPVLGSSITAPTLAAAYSVQQAESVSIDYFDIRTGTPSDNGMGYGCVYDQLIDGAVLLGTQCANLPGAVDFNTVTGILNWTPNASAFGAYEIKVTGTNVAGNDSTLGVVSVVPAGGVTPFTLSPSSFDYGTLGNGGATGDQTFTVTNATAAAGLMGSVSLTGQTAQFSFPLGTNNCPAANSQLAPAASCTFVVRFTPVTGSYTAGVSIGYNSNATAAIALTATAVDAPTLVSNPSALDLAHAYTVNQGSLATVDFGNGAATTDTGMSYTCTYDQVVSNSVVGGTACTSLPGTVTFNTSTGVLSWTPSALAFGAYEIKVVGTNVAGSSSLIAVVSVTPSGVLSPFTLSPSSFGYGNLANGGAAVDQTFTVTNSTAAGVTMGSFSLTGQNTQLSFPASTNNCPAANSQLAPAASCTFVVRFTPVTGVYAAAVSIGYNSSATTTIALTATALAAPSLTSSVASPYTINQGAPATFDINNSITGDDTGMGYTCVYDQVIDGAVSGGTACTLLPGTATFNTSTGVFAWTPNSSAFGEYELKIAGTNAAGVSGTLYEVMSVTPVGGTKPFTFSPTSLAYGNVLVANGVSDLTVRATNATAYNVVMGTISLTGQTAQYSIISNNCPGSGSILSASAYCDITVRFTPVAGSFTANLSIAYDTNQTTTIALTAAGFAVPSLVNTGDLTFPTHYVTQGTQATIDWGNGTAGNDSGMSYTCFYDSQMNSTYGTGCESLPGTGAALYSGTVLADSPSAYWRLGEAVGATVAADSAGTNVGGYYGTPTLGTASGLSGDSNTAAYFDGSSAYMTVPDAAALNFASAGQMSMELWINPTSVPPVSNRWILDKYTAANNGYIVFQTITGTIGFIVGNGTTLYTIYTPAALPLGSWSHLVATVTATSQKVYLNGVQVAIASSSITLVDSPGAFYMGKYSGGAFFNGALDEVALYPTALSAAQVLSHYNAGVAKKFNTASGVLTWTPDPTSWGAYEVRVTGTNLAGNSSSTANIDVRPPYVQTSLTAAYDAPFGALTRPGSNPATQWRDIFASYDGTLYGTSSVPQWAGSGVNASPYALSFTASDSNRVDLGSTVISSNQNTVMLTSWVASADVSTATGGGKVVLGNGGGASGNGFVLHQSPNTAGIIELAVGPKQKYKDVILADGPNDYWRFGEAAGTTAANSVTANAAVGGTYVSPTLAQPGALSGDTSTSAYFDGAASYVTVSNNAALNFASAGQMTIEFWINPVAVGTNRYIIGKYSSNNGYIVTYTTSGQLNFFAGNGTTLLTIGSTAALTYGSWSHVVAVIAPTWQKIYVNGGQVASGTQAVTLVDSSTTLYLGISQNVVSPFNGYLQEFALYPYALSAGQVAAHHNAGLGTFANNPVLAGQPKGYWRLGEPVGSLSAIDLSGNTNTGTYTGGYTLGTAGAITGDGDTAATFNGTTGYVTTASTTAINPTSQLSMSAWINPAAANTNSGIIYKGSFASAQGDYQLILNTNIYFRLNGGAVTLIGPVPANNTWSHVVATYDGAMMKIYVNGSSSWSTAYSTVVNSSNTPLVIGAHYSSSYTFNGSIDDVAVFDYALNPQQISAIFTSSKFKSCQTRTPLTNNLWAMVSALFDGTTMSLFLNGTQECSFVPTSNTFTTPSTNLTVGATSTGATAWGGAMGDLKVYTSGSSANITTNFNATVDHYRTSPMGNIVTSGLAYHFDAANAVSAMWPATTGCNQQGWLSMDSTVTASLMDYSAPCNSPSTSGWNGTGATNAPYVLNLNGTNTTGNYVSIPNGFTTAITSNDYHTVEIWVKAASAANLPLLFSNAGSSYYTRFGTGNMWWLVGGVFRNYTLTTANWNQFVFVKTGAGDNGNFYVNGALQTPASGTLGNTPATASAMALGTWNGDAVSNLSGSIANVKIYNRSLSQAEVRQNCNALKARFSGFVCN
ncbi:LamG-like jellyroll fold domain-containing protein [Bdellovibrionota bacterium FG-1]